MNDGPLIGCLAAGVLALGVMAAGAGGERGPADGVAGGAPVVRRVQPHPGGLRVIGGEPSDRMILSKWSARMLRRLEDLTDLAYPLRDETAAILVRTVSNSPPTAILRSGIADGMFKQKLTLVNYADMDRLAADEALCRMALQSVVARQAERAPDAAGTSTNAPPAWLSRGLALNLLPDRRARYGEASVALSAQGRVPELAHLTGARDGVTPDEEQILDGLLVGWVLSWPDSGGAFTAMLDAVAREGGVAPGVVQELAAGTAGAGAAERGWRAWVDGQSRMLRQVGRTTAVDVRELKSALLISPGESGIPLDAAFPEGSTLRALIPLRRQPWIHGLVERKTSELRTLALGRGTEFIETVELYCGFLTALPRRFARAGAKLERAEAALEALESKVRRDEAEAAKSAGRE